MGEIAVGSKGRKGIAERVEVSLEFRAVLRVEGVEPAAAGEEPVARVAGWESSVSGQHDKISRMSLATACTRQSVVPYVYGKLDMGGKSKDVTLKSTSFWTACTQSRTSPEELC